MPNPLKVSLENIIPLTEARDHFSQIVAEVQKDKLYVLTKGGKPAVAIIDVKYLEAITGGEVKPAQIHEEIKKAPEKVGLPPMIEHNAPPTAVPSTPKPYIPPANISTAPAPTKPLITPPESTPAPAPMPTPNPIASSPNPNPIPPAPKPAPPINPKPTAQPLKTPPTSGDKIDIQFNADQDSNPAQDQKSHLDPNDKASPAQFAGKQEEEVADMGID